MGDLSGAQRGEGIAHLVQKVNQRALIQPCGRQVVLQVTLLAEPLMMMKKREKRRKD
jgi:hypothetical protein